MTETEQATDRIRQDGPPMIDNFITRCIGRMIPPTMHAWFCELTGWMFAAVWIRSEQQHKWMWVREKEYYGDCLFAPEEESDDRA